MEPGELTKFRNLEVEYFELTQKVPVAAKELSDMISKAHKERDELIAECDAKLATLKEEETELSKKRKIFEEHEKTSNGMKEAADTAYFKVAKELKQALKDLSRTNSQVLAANEELLTVRLCINNANEQLKSLLILVAKVEETKVRLTELTDLKNRTINEIKNEQQASDVKLRITNSELVRMKEELVKVQQETEKARYLWENYNKELYKNMSDYAVIKARIEGVWRKTFPELEIPLGT